MENKITRMDAAKKWIDEFNEIPYALMEKAYKDDYEAIQVIGPTQEYFAKTKKADYPDADEDDLYEACHAEAEINVNGITQTIRSGGCWGIESDTERAYRETIAGEEYDALMGQLEALNVDMPRRMWVNGDYRADLKRDVLDRMNNTGSKTDFINSPWVKVELS